MNIKNTYTSIVSIKYPQFLDITLVIVGSILSWWPLLQNRPFIEDDFTFYPIILNGISSYWDLFGCWRLIGHPAPFLMLKLSSLGPNILALIVHVVTVLIFYFCLKQLSVSRGIRLLVSFFLGIIPFGFQALTWNSAMTFSISGMFFLSAFLSLLLSSQKLCFANIFLGIISGLFIFLSTSSNEAVLLLSSWLFCLPFINLFLDRNIKPIQNKDVLMTFFLSICILTAQLGWIFLHLATRTENFDKEPQTLNLITFVSGILYQTKQITYLTHLNVLFEYLSIPSIVSLLGLIIVCFCIAIISYHSIYGSISTKEEKIRSSNLFLLYISCMPIAAVGIYSLGDGFSLDSRKAYIIWICLLTVFAYFLDRASKKIRTSIVFFVLLCCPLFFLSTHGVINLSYAVAHKFELAYNVILEENIANPINFVWDDNIYQKWSDFEILTGFRYDSQHIFRKIPLAKDRNLTSLVYDEIGATWKIVK